MRNESARCCRALAAETGQGVRAVKREWRRLTSRQRRPWLKRYRGQRASK